MPTNPDSEASLPIQKNRVGRPPKPKNPDEILKPKRSIGRPRINEPGKMTIFMAKPSEQITLREIAQNFGYVASNGKHIGTGSINGLNRAIANGKLIALKIEKSILETITQKYHLNSIEEYLKALADGLIDYKIARIQENQTESIINKPPRQRRSHKPTSKDQVGIKISDTEMLVLRAIALKFNLTIPSGKDAGDGSVSALNRAIADRRISLFCLTQDTLDKLWAIAQSQGFHSVEEFLTAISIRP